MAGPAPTTTAEPAPAPDAHPKHDLHHYKDTHHAGIDQLIALSSGGAKRPPAARVAELIELHPRDKDKMIAFMHEHHHVFGNAFVHEVLADHKLAHRADLVDNALGKHNRHNQGTHGSNGADPNRLETRGHVEAKLAVATQVYRNDGTAYEEGAQAPAGATVQINAGNVRTMQLAGAAPEKCVMAFHQAVGATGVTGWIPVGALDATGKKLAGIDAKLERDLDRDREHAGATKFSHTARLVQAVAPPATMKNLRTAPNQDPHGGANEPEHYFARPGGVVNLLDNAPTSGGKRYGVAIDVLAPGSKFYAAEPHLTEHTQLWESGAKTLTDKAITFIYGKAEAASGGEASYGWINVACLS